MREVSNRVFDPIFRELAKRRIDPAALVEGTGCELAFLERRRERLDWDRYLRVMENVSAIWPTDAELHALGARFTRSMALRPLAAVARVLFTPRDFYRWGSQMGEGTAEGMFGTIRSELADLGPQRMRIRLSMKEGYAPCRAFFVITAGAYAALPALLGLPDARVAVEYGDADATYLIDYPGGGGALAKLRRLLLWPFTARAAARELRDAHRDLQLRFGELSAAQAELTAANARLAAQTARLETAERVGRAIQAELSLDFRAEQALRALLETGDVRAAELELDASIGDVRLTHSLRRGEPLEGAPELHALRAPGGDWGVLRVWRRVGADGLDELLALLVPILGLALGQALSFEAVRAYQRTLEARVELRTRELKDANDRIGQTLADLEEVSAARDRLFDNINHEIRTPLTITSLATEQVRALLGGGRELATRPELREVGDKLDAIAEATRRLLRMTHHLLLLASTRESRLRLEVQERDLAHHARELVRMWRVPAEAKGLILEYVGPTSLVARYDESLVDDVLGNLLSNAVKFTLEGAIEVSLGLLGSEVELSVRDTGPGIDADLRARLFGRFEQGTASFRRGYRGTGLGLAIVREVVEAHGGTVRAEPAGNAGTVFRVRVPRGTTTPSVPRAPTPAPHAAPSRSPPQERPIVLEALSPSAKHTILLAEDNAEVREAVGQILRRDHRVLLASQGFAALSLAAAHGVDLLVSDVSMPGMDGFELTARFRELPGNRLAPVVLMSAYGQLRNRLAGFEAGAVDFVIKPFEPEELLARVGSQLRLRELALRLHESEQLAATAVLAAGVAHEVRNPANGIANLVAPLKQLIPAALFDERPQLAQLFSVLELCAGQIREVSRHLMDLRADRRASAWRPRSGAAILDDAIAVVAPALRERGVELEERRGPPLEVRCNASAVVRVLVNLLENGAQAAGRGGRVTLEERAAAERWVVEVSDSGPGVPFELRARIFDAFFTTKAQGEGTGLGLTICRRIAVEHGGSLELVSSPRGGATFRLELPLEPGSGALGDDEGRRVPDQALEERSGAHVAKARALE